MQNLLRYARFSLFIIYFWFGILKVLGLSPAEELVQQLYRATLGQWIIWDSFPILFGAVECLIGILWLIPKFSRIALNLLILHMVSTFLPCFFLPESSWQYLFTPTLIGQYIIKNLALISCGFFIYKVQGEQKEYLKGFIPE